MRGILAYALSSGLCAASTLAAEPETPNTERRPSDAEIVAACDAAARRGPLSPGDAAFCSEAYERLVARHGGYEAYRASRRSAAEPVSEE
jgi:hypothetical protein